MAYRVNDSMISEILNSDIGAPFAWQHFGEQNLTEQPYESYRFLYSAAFDEYKKIYKITRANSAASLTIKTIVYHYDSLDNRSKSVDEKTRELSAIEWSELKKSIEDVCFWNMLTYDFRRGLDGDTWLLEGFDPNNNLCHDRPYHVALRWSPNSSSQSFIDICNKFKSLELE